MARTFPARRRQKTRWAMGTGGVDFLALAAGTIGETVFTAGTLEETILRIRGNLLAYVDAVQNPGALALIGVGMIMMPEGTGTTVTSSPISDGNAPWIWHETFHIGWEEGVADVEAVQTIGMFRAVIDNKSMRIARPDRELQVVAENVTVGNAVAVNILLSPRFLLQQP